MISSDHMDDFCNLSGKKESPCTRRPFSAYFHAVLPCVPEFQLKLLTLGRLVFDLTGSFIDPLGVCVNLIERR